MLLDEKQGQTVTFLHRSDTCGQGCLTLILHLKLHKSQSTFVLFIVESWFSAVPTMYWILDQYFLDKWMAKWMNEAAKTENESLAIPFTSYKEFELW